MPLCGSSLCAGWPIKDRQVPMESGVLACQAGVALAGRAGAWGDACEPCPLPFTLSGSGLQAVWL